MLAEKGLKETKSTNEAGEKLCPVTSLPYVEEDVIVLHQHLHDAEKQAEEHKEYMKTLESEKKKKKKKKKAKDEDEDVVEDAPVKKRKVDPTQTIKEKSKSDIYKSLFRQGKNEPVSAEDLLMKGERLLSYCA